MSFEKSITKLSAKCLIYGFLIVINTTMTRAATTPAEHDAGKVMMPCDLRCEYLHDPLGIDVVRPRLSWKLKASLQTRAARQSAYQVLVASSTEKLVADEGDLWDSGKVEADTQLHVPYSGKPLLSRDLCYWKVRVWDERGIPSAWSEGGIWSMGLLQPEDWQAIWIAREQTSQTPAPKNGYHSGIAQTPDTSKWVNIDLGTTRTVDAVRMWPACPFNWQPYTAGFLFPLRFRIETATKSDFSDLQVVVDRTREDVPNPGNAPLTCEFKPVLARYVRLHATSLRARDTNGSHAMALAELEVLAQGENVAKGAKLDAQDAIEDSGWALANLVDGCLESDRSDVMNPATLLRKEFVVDGPVRRATLSATGLGLYELWLNGCRVGKDILAPEFTKYERRVQYRTYDVTDMLNSGLNAVGGILADGWHGGRCWGALPVGQRIFGGQRGLRIRMDIELADGTKAVVVTDPTWRTSDAGPIRSAGLFDGESYDARMEMPGWDKPGYDDTMWTRAVPVDFPGTATVAQPNEPMQVTKILTPKRLTEPDSGVYVFDLGQNMVGWCRLKIRAARGTRIMLRHAEALDDNGRLYTANLRSASQQDIYICRGDGEEVFEPRFTYHGFRYVEVGGLTERPSVSDITGRVIRSSASESGRFECSNPLVNQLMNNALWSQFGNLTSIPTDCPQRDERAGWMGDIQAFSQSAIFNMDMGAFFTKWLFDVRDSQADDGRYSPISPTPEDPNLQLNGGPAWGDAGVIIPWRVFENYGDVRLLEQHIDSARRWVDLIHASNRDLIWSNQRGFDFGDWLNGDTLVLDGFPRTGNEIPKDVLATAFWQQSTRILSKMFAVIGRKDDSEKYSTLADGIRKAFNEHFVADDGKIKGDTQAGYALALRLGLLDERRQAQATTHLLAAIERYHGHLSTGIQTTHHAMLALSEHGHHDVAARLMNLRTVPSWGYTIDMGATTIWERWDGYVKDRGFQDPAMNSFNHWALGSVAEWVWRNIAGMNSDDVQPGWKHFVIAPKPGSGITWVKSEYESIRGRIACDWKVDGTKFSLQVTVPPNSTATVYVPGIQGKDVTEAGLPAGQAKGVKFLRAENDAAVFEIGSGTYVFQSTLPENLPTR